MKLGNILYVSESMTRTLLQGVLCAFEKVRLQEHSQLRAVRTPFPSPSFTAVHSLSEWGWFSKWNFFSECNSSCVRNLFRKMLFKSIQFLMNTTACQKFITQESVLHNLFYRDYALVAYWPNPIFGIALFTCLQCFKTFWNNSFFF